jgi:hypothetical protein
MTPDRTATGDVGGVGGAADSISSDNRARTDRGRWIWTGRSRTEARLAALQNHPVRWITRWIHRQRGVSIAVTPPTSREEILRRLSELPLSVWTYGFDDQTVRHMGPMAHDFAAAFGLGDSDRTIAMVDALGVCMAAIQGLHTKVIELEQRLDHQQNQPGHPLS